MNYRRLGRTGVRVSELTAGTWGWDARLWKDLDRAEAEASLLLAIERGVTMIDTAAAYGDAESEIGRILGENTLRDEVFVATKIAPVIPIELPSPHIRADEAFPASHIIDSTHASLRTLGVERIGLQQLHTWSPTWLHEGEWFDALSHLKRSGKVGAIGVSLFDHDPESALALVKSGAVDCIQVLYNLFDQSPAHALLPACLEHGVAVIARSPILAGALSQQIRADIPFQEGDWRRDYFYPEHLEETRRRAAALEALVRPPDQSLADLALRFALSHPAVSTVAVGMRRRRHVYENLRVANGPLHDDAMLQALRSHAWLC